MDFPELYKELEAEIYGAGEKRMGLQFLQLELRLGKTPSRSFRPVKSAEILWQFWTSCSLRVSLAHDDSWSNLVALDLGSTRSSRQKGFKLCDDVVSFVYGSDANATENN
ncbi:hypothetical protein Tco_0051392 [Tanacetum coccineum]